MEAKVLTSPCYRCRQAVPRQDVVRQQLPRGTDGRRHTAYVLMCSDCASQQRSTNKTAAVIGLAVLGLTLLLFLALGIPLNRPLR